MRRSMLVSVLLVSLACAHADAALTLDQEYAPGDTNVFFTFCELTRAQTFTAGVPGLLSRFEVLISASTPGTRLFEVHSTTGGVPVLGSTPLASALIAYDATGGAAFYGADISGFGIYVNPGDVLAIVDAELSNAPASWAGREYDGLYAGGDVYSTIWTDPPYCTIISGNYVAQPDDDLGFRTYVDTGLAVIPAPGAILLGALGSGLVGWLRRRRCL